MTLIPKSVTSHDQPDNPVTIEIRKMTLVDYPGCYHLWESTPGLGLTDDDHQKGIAVYLKHNANRCFVAVAEGAIIATILCGHDGRRGMLRHLAVHHAYRNRGLAKKLVGLCLRELAADGIRKCNVCVMDDNLSGRAFWEKQGAKMLEYDWRTLQFSTAAL